MTPGNSTKPDLATKRQWVYDSKTVSSLWREQAWRDFEMFDGGEDAWTSADWNKAKAAGLDPLTINRIFPVVNMVLGTEAINKFDIILKGRSHKDSDIAKTMSEGVKYIMDVSDGEWSVSDAFYDGVIGGVGWISPTLEQDPRREKLAVRYRDWKEVWWDPFSIGGPWVNPRTARYVFMQRWLDLETVIAAFPEKKKDLQEHVADLEKQVDSPYAAYDEAQMLEDYRRSVRGINWVDKIRRRIRPVEMWYTVFEKSWFAVFANDRVLEVKPDEDHHKVMEMIREAKEVVGSTVPRVYVSTFIGDLELSDDKSPFVHDQYPLIPFVSYMNRWKDPFGVPRQIRGQNEEINKRRTMALGMLKARRVIMEKGAVSGGTKGYQRAFNEANKLDGLVVVEKGKLGAIKIEEQAELYRPQMDILMQSEREIQEISGANDESRGVESNATSGVALEKRIQRSQIMLAKLFDNYRRTLKMVGEQLSANMQQYWNKEKVLRITDRLTGAERFVILNQVIIGESGKIERRNDISQIAYDLVVTEAPQTDTVREQNMNLLIETMKKSPPEMIPQLWLMAMEISNLPNKEQLIERMRPLLGVDPIMDESPEEAKQKALALLEAQKQEQAERSDMEKNLISLQSEQLRLENAKLQAEIQKIISDARVQRATGIANIKDKENKMRIERAKAVNEIRNPGANVVPMKTGKSAETAKKNSKWQQMLNRQEKPK